MSIQKKSLISTLKTAKKANVASSHEVDAKGAKIASMRIGHTKQVTAKQGTHMRSFKISSSKRGFAKSGQVSAKRPVA